ncbi:MAG: SoxR reducing system RseC family protein [Tannerellaceae bacterium]|nr:SoxR reducing system RseC family protein [Tannerellaceae bacterium]
MGNEINHTGIIKEIGEHSILVKIVQQSACAGCHAKGMCSAVDNKEKIIEIQDSSGNFHVNEEVVISGKTSLGLQAVVLAFIIPLILIVATLITGSLIQWEESTNALIALFILLLYYCILYLNREKLKKKFIFTLKKLNQ